jgi:hypothetical protein
LEWVGDEVVPRPGDELELTERIGRDAGEDGHDGGGGHTRLPENLRRTWVGGRYLGGKDRRATEGKDGRWQRQAAAAQGDGRRRFWSLLGYFWRIAKIAGGKSANVHKQVGGLKREIYPHHWMVILWSKLPACRLALNGCLHPGRCHG